MSREGDTDTDTVFLFKNPSPEDPFPFLLSCSSFLLLVIGQSLSKSVHRCLYCFLLLVRALGFLVRTIWPIFLQLKHAPFFISWEHSLVDIESTSMVFGSFSFLVGKENFFFPLSFLWPSFFLPKMCCIFCQLEWNLVAFSYHCSKVVGGFSQFITCF